MSDFIPVHPSDLAILDALRGGVTPLLARKVARVTGLSPQQCGKRLADLCAHGVTFRKTEISGSLVEYAYMVHPDWKPGKVGRAA